MRHQAARLSPVISICGPSGVGKTTVIKGLAKLCPTFIETTKGNPHLKGLLEGRKEFNAAANQEWFLKRIGRYIAKAKPNLPLVLDQDPAAIVFGYAKMFLDEGKMNSTDYELLLEQLMKIETSLQRWRSPRTVLFLDAPPVILHRRALNRADGKSSVPPLKWFERNRNYFVNLFTCFPKAIRISTVDHSADEIVERARGLIER